MLLYSILRACIYLSIGVVYSPSPNDCVSTVTNSNILYKVKSRWNFGEAYMQSFALYTLSESCVS